MITFNNNENLKQDFLALSIHEKDPAYLLNVSESFDIPIWFLFWASILSSESCAKVLNALPVGKDIEKAKSHVTIFRLNECANRLIDQDELAAVSWIMQGHRAILKGRVFNPQHDFKPALEKLQNGCKAAHFSAFNYESPFSFAFSFGSAQRTLPNGYEEAEVNEMIKFLQEL